MEEKKLRSQRRSSAPKAQKFSSASPAPKSAGSFAMCGHDGCGSTCRVRYVGPVSHLRDHHALHAARGVGHVWTAAVVTGLAVVLTGAVAYTAVQARTEGGTAARPSADTRALMERMDKMEQTIRDMSERCTRALPADTEPAADEPAAAEPEAKK